jgi:hypothetical protein
MSNSNTDDDFAPLPQFKETRNSNKNWVVTTLVKLGSDGSVAQTLAITPKVKPNS